MDKNNLLKKILVVGITILFIGINTLTTTAEENKTVKKASFENTKTNVKMMSDKGGPLPVFFGDKGNNDWYISDVLIIFQYDPADVAEIYYRIGDEWIKYTGPFTISEDGSHFIPWYWIDKYGVRWNEPALEFKIDQTPPTITLKKQTMTNDRVKFTATANDATSGLEKVEFYLDDEIQTTITAPPYEWIWQGTTNHIVKAIAYDYAGHMKESNKLSTSYPGFSIPSSPVNKPLKKNKTIKKNN